MSKKLPPYAKKAHPISGGQLSIRYGWPTGKPRQDTMVLPDDRPEQYRWPVKGCDVFVTAISAPIPPQVAQSLLDALAGAGAKTIVIRGTRKDASGKLAGLHFWPGTLISGVAA